MQEKELGMDLSYVDEHRLEIENRMKNLFWTVSGDYRMETHPDLELYRENPDAAVYETVRYGAFSRDYSADEVALYIWKKSRGSSRQELLMMLFHVCMDAAVYDRLVLERRGIRDMRAAAEAELRKERQALIKAIVFPETESTFALELTAFQEIRDTETFIGQVDRIYNRFFDPNYEKSYGSLRQVLELPDLEMSEAASQEALSDEQMDEIIKKYLEDLKKDMHRLRRKKKETVYRPGDAMKQEITNEDMPDPEAARKVKDYVLLNYGKNSLGSVELAALHWKYCRGIHAGCSLHFTDGILHAPVLKNNQYRFSQLQLEKNRFHYYNNHWIVKRNIADLTDVLQKALVRKADAETGRALYGQIVPGRLWKVGRTEDEKLFDKQKPVGNQEYVLDILLDSSGSQAKRQPQVAVQGYIISEALSRAGIPHRVMSFCSFWDYTILHRFRDFDDENENSLRILEFRATGNNRDGLAVKVAGDFLMRRPEENRILIVLSDGKPCDVTVKRPGTQAVRSYQGDAAVRDTALSVRDLRKKGITVLGIFSGDEADISSEQKIYGKDFAYIRDLRGFSKMVGSYLKRQIETEE